MDGVFTAAILNMERCLDHSERAILDDVPDVPPRPRHPPLLLLHSLLLLCYSLCQSITNQFGHHRVGSGPLGLPLMVCKRLRQLHSIIPK